MPPYFIFLMTMLFYTIYFQTHWWPLLLSSILYQIVWFTGFALFSDIVPYLSYEHTKAGGVAWTIIYTVYNIGFILRDFEIIPKSYFFILLALADITIAVCVLTMVCNTLRDRGKFWSSNMLELASLGWLSTQVVRGIVLSSGGPILLGILIIRFVQDGVYKELILWLFCAVIEFFVEDTTIVYISLSVSLALAFFYIYRHNTLFIVLSPFLLLYVLFVVLIKLRKKKWSNAVNEVKLDGIQFYEGISGYFLPLPLRNDDAPPAPPVWWR